MPQKPKQKRQEPKPLQITITLPKWTRHLRVYAQWYKTAKKHGVALILAATFFCFCWLAMLGYMLIVTSP